MMSRPPCPAGLAPPTRSGAFSGKRPNGPRAAAAGAAPRPPAFAAGGCCRISGMSTTTMELARTAGAMPSANAFTAAAPMRRHVEHAPRGRVLSARASAEGIVRHDFNVPLRAGVLDDRNRAVGDAAFPAREAELVALEREAERRHLLREKFLERAALRRAGHADRTEVVQLLEPSGECRRVRQKRRIVAGDLPDVGSSREETLQETLQGSRTPRPRAAFRQA